jgi:hypothetical protein
MKAYRLWFRIAFLVAGLGVSATTLLADAVIDNGVVELGVVDTGNLIISELQIGLTFLPTGGEALAPGCDCEGWGAADAATGLTGFAGDVFGISGNMSVVDFTSTPTSAVSVVSIIDSNETAVLQVTHDFHPSVSPNLYEVTVSIVNVSSSAIGDLRYRRAMDWDVPPTEFSEFVTLQRGGSTKLLFSSDDGFADGDPLAGPSSINFSDADVVDNGPDDHGALFDFGFGSLAAGATNKFKIYYGAAATENQALAALAKVGAEVYSLGQPDFSDSDPTQGPTTGKPNTFIFGFAGVGGKKFTGPCSDVAGLIDQVDALGLPRGQTKRLEREVVKIGKAVSRRNARAARANCGVLARYLTALVRSGAISSSTASSIESCCDSFAATASTSGSSRI